jgi:hypothetical protein
MHKRIVEIETGPEVGKRGGREANIGRFEPFKTR